MGEYISREAVEQVLRGIANGLSVGETEALKAKGLKALYKIQGAKEILNSVDNDLCFIPAADVQIVKHGRWIEQRHTPTNGYNYNVPYSTYVCSICGLEIHSEEYSKYVRGAYTNCPVCTARMDGDTNDCH